MDGMNSGAPMPSDILRQCLESCARWLCWYYFGRSRAPVLAAATAVIFVDALGILSAGGMDLSRVSFARGFDLEIAAITLPLGAYVAAHFVSRLARGRGQA